MLFRVHSLSMSKSNPIIFWIQESLGFTRARNLAAWGVAGGIAYYLWILPAHKDAARRKAIVEEWKEKYRESPNLYPVDRKKLKNAANSDSESVTASGDK